MTIVTTTVTKWYRKKSYIFGMLDRVNWEHILPLPESKLISNKVFILTLSLHSFIYTFPLFKFFLKISSPNLIPTSQILANENSLITLKILSKYFLGLSAFVLTQSFPTQLCQSLTSSSLSFSKVLQDESVLTSSTSILWLSRSLR